MYVCICNAIRDRDLRQAAEAGCRSFEELQAATRVATCCGRCEPMARAVFDRALDPGALAVHPA
jgi:bacterioferritin-associated ferredoxin